MAQQDPPKSSAWGMWSSFVDTVTTTVKQKSDELLAVYKEDLQEFSRTIVADTSAVIKDKVDRFHTEPSPNLKSNKISSLQARILRIQRDPKTYDTEPTDAGYVSWSEAFNVGAPENTEAITDLLTNNESVREFHTALVPTKVVYRDFWCRYYFRIHQLEEEEKRRAAILNNANANDDEEFSWDVEDDSNAQKAPQATEVSPAIESEATEEQTTPSASTAAIIPTTTTAPTPTTPTTPTKTSPDTSDTTPTTPITPTDVPPTTPSSKAVVQETADIPKSDTPAKLQESPAPITEVSSDADDIDEEIARKFEAQKNEKKEEGQPDSPKSDAEEGWADWE